MSSQDIIARPPRASFGPSQASCAGRCCQKLPRVRPLGFSERSRSSRPGPALQVTCTAFQLVGVPEQGHSKKPEPHPCWGHWWKVCSVTLKPASKADFKTCSAFASSVLELANSPAHCVVLRIRARLRLSCGQDWPHIPVRPEPRSQMFSPEGTRWHEYDLTRLTARAQAMADPSRSRGCFAPDSVRPCHFDDGYDLVMLQLCYVYTRILACRAHPGVQLPSVKSHPSCETYRHIDISLIYANHF